MTSLSRWESSEATRIAPFVLRIFCVCILSPLSFRFGGSGRSRGPSRRTTAPIGEGLSNERHDGTIARGPGPAIGLHGDAPGERAHTLVVISDADSLASSCARGKRPQPNAVRDRDGAWSAPRRGLTLHR